MLSYSSVINRIYCVISQPRYLLQLLQNTSKQYESKGAAGTFEVETFGDESQDQQASVRLTRQRGMKTTDLYD